MKFKLCSIAACVALAFAGAVQAQSSTTPADRGAAAPSTVPATPKADRGAPDRKMKHAEEEKIEADYKADKAKCDAMSGNAKDVCMKEAKGKEKVAKAELDAKYDNSPRAQEKLAKAKAEAEYDVAKERCDDQKGKEKSACEKEAKAARDRAIAAAKADTKGAKSATRGASAERTADRKP